MVDVYNGFTDGWPTEPQILMNVRQEKMSVIAMPPASISLEPTTVAAMQASLEQATPANLHLTSVRETMACVILTQTARTQSSRSPALAEKVTLEMELFVTVHTSSTKH